MSTHSHRVDSQPHARHVASDLTVGQLGGDRSHVVRRGDDLKSLAATHGVSQRSIVDANQHLIVDRSRPLVVGDRLHIPPPTSATWQRLDGVAGNARTGAGDQASPTLTHYRDTVSLPRDNHPAPDTPKRLADIVAEVNGVMRPHHADLASRNRVVHVRGPDAGEYVDFPVKPGVRMVTGDGEFRGTLAADTVNLNYGQRKVITCTDNNGVATTQTYVHAFATQVHRGGETDGASGWIPLSALTPSTARSRYGDDLRADVKHGPMGGDAPQSYTVSGGDRGKYDDLKVNPGIDRTDREAAGDYLWRRNDPDGVREKGVVNLLYSLPGSGGASTDTVKVGEGTVFVPSAGVPRVKVPLYLPANATSAERAAWRDGTSPHAMEFVYGSIVEPRPDGTENRRYGWIAADTLTPATTS